MGRWISKWLFPRPSGPLVIAQPRLTQDRGTSRVSLRIDGQELWFESSDVPLSAIPEAFATALLVPSLKLGRPLRIDSPVCSTWHENQRAAAQLTAGWWNYPRLDSPQVTHAMLVDSSTAGPCSTRPHTDSQTLSIRRDNDIDQNNGRCSTALCFTGGVDSFFTLLRAEPTADILVFASGYDVDLRDRHLVRTAEKTVRNVAAEFGKRAVVITSNLRRHRTFRVESWERTHGSALGAIGHLLSDHVSRLQISASQPYGSSTLWGSRWDLDPLFASSRLTIQHFGAELIRTQKLWQIASEPIVQRHLRVCWVRHRGEGNCGQCEKCVRTMLVLETCGQLENYPTLGKRDDLAARIDAVPSIPWGTIIAYSALTQRDMRPDIRRAVDRLLERTHAAIASSDSNRRAA